MNTSERLIAAMATEQELKSGIRWVVCKKAICRSDTMNVCVTTGGVHVIAGQHFLSIITQAIQCWQKHFCATGLGKLTGEWII